MNKKILKIGIGLLVIGLLIFVGLFFFSNPEGSISKNIKNILPFGQGGGDVAQSADKDFPEEVIATDESKSLAKLFRLSEVPVAGAVGFIKNNSTFVRYSDRATGHIYDINPATLEKIKITNNTLPKIYEAHFKKDASGVIYRSLVNNTDQISNTSIDIIPPKSTSTNALYNIYSTVLRGDIGDVSVGNASNISYNLKDEGAIVISAFNGSGRQTLFNSSFTDWQIDWPGKNIVILTKPSAGAAGFAYTLNPVNGAINKLEGPLNGLTVLVNFLDNKFVYSYNDEGLTRFFYGDLLDGTRGELSPSTFASKCVWSKKVAPLIYCGSPVSTIGITAGEPDLWYQGVTHYSDQVWLHDTEGGESRVVLDPKKDFNLDLDIINPFLTPDEDYFIFTNKNDLSLWALKLSQ
ncbi:MAG: hypothetical protein M3Q24_01050 [bacterium]|nr:hypothetical protein [bacterium]